MDRVVGVSLLELLAAAHSLRGDPGLELGAVGAALVYRSEPLLTGGAPPQRLTMDPVQKTQTT